MNDYTAYASLAEPLPPLVRKQRRLEAQLVPLANLAEDEKAVRQQIDRLLVAAGIVKGDGVSCLGYDVTHIERAGTSRLNEDLILAQFVTAGVDRDLVLKVLLESTEVGPPSTWASVKPAKGAKVRVEVAAQRRGKG